MEARNDYDEKRYECEFCNKTFLINSCLKIHLRIHTGEKPYRCKFCNKAFSQVGNLNSHVRIHTGEKPYKCIFCNKAFIQLTQLNNHTRTHTGEKPFTCKVCCKAFKQVTNLNNHVRAHTNTELPIYDLHDKAFDELGYLYQHFKVQTIKKPHICQFCDKAFQYACHLKRHRRTHGEEKADMSMCTENSTEQTLEEIDLLSDQICAMKVKKGNRKKCHRSASHSDHRFDRKEPPDVESREIEMAIQATIGHLTNALDVNLQFFTVKQFGCGICNEMFEFEESFLEHCNNCDAPLKDILGEVFERHLLLEDRNQ